MKTESQPTISLHKNAAAAHRHSLETAELLLTSLQRMVAEAKLAKHVNWGNVGDVNHLNSLLRKADQITL